MSDNRRRRHNSNPRNRTNGGDRNLQTQLMNGGTKTTKGLVQRTSSYDTVRKIVQEEGRTARNLIGWTVPVEDEGADSGKRIAYRPRLRVSKSPSSSSRENTPPPKKAHEKSGTSSGRSTPSRGSKKSDLRARYWAFLFDNLQRAVDEIYQTCEADESVLECKEVIMMLEQCTKDFKNLIERLEVMEAYENAEKKPISIAWEIRKTSPGKSLHTGDRVISPSPVISRSLNFAERGSEAETEVHLPLPPGNSWADKVRSYSMDSGETRLQNSSEGETVKPEKNDIGEIPVNETHISKDTEVVSRSETVEKVGPDRVSSPQEDDGEGWETVHRNNHRTRSKNSPVQTGPHGRLKGNRTPQNHRNNAQKRTGVTPKQQQDHSTQKGPANGSHKSPSGPGMGKKTPSYSDIAARGSPKGSQTGLNKTKASSHENLDTSHKGARSPGKGPQQSAFGQPKRQQPSGQQKSPVKPKTFQTEVLQSNTQNPICDKKSVKGNPESDQNKQQDMSASQGVASDDRKISPTKEEIEEDPESVASRDDEDDVALLEDALVTAMEEEDSLADRLEQEQDQALQSAIQEEENYLKQIEREESMEIEVDTEPETETDTELGNTMSSLEASQSTLDWDSMVLKFEQAEREGGSEASWGDLVEEAETRTPGRSVHMHEKLSSPSRKRSAVESKKRHDEKQAKAQELREKLLQEKAERLKELSNKVEEVRAWKNELLLQKKETMKDKLRRAEEKRQRQLRMKVRKAHEEETKANEIAFINTLEAQNKRHDILAKHQESQARLQDLQEERQRKHEEKLAKEVAVEERRKALEAERLAKLQDMQERRKKKEIQIEQQQMEKEKEKKEVAKQREKDREERVAALHAQQQAHIDELRTKIQLKQDETARRHNVILDQIREKAFEMSVINHSTEDHNEAPRLVPYDTMKVCQVCNVLIPSEVYLLSHLRGKKHQEAIKENNEGKVMAKTDIELFNLKHIQDAPPEASDLPIMSDKERQKAMKKRCKKLRQRMMARGSEYENALSGKQATGESPQKAKLQKLVKDINKSLQTQGSGPWPQSRVSMLDRILGELSRILEKKTAADQVSFRICGGMTALSRLLLVIEQSTDSLPPVIPAKSLALACNVYKYACKGNYENCHYLLFSNKIGSLLDLLSHQLNLTIPDNLDVRPPSALGGSTAQATPHLPHDVVCTSLMQLIATILSCLAKQNPSSNSSEASAERMSSTGDAFMSRGNDIISYIIAVGIMDKLTIYFSNVRGPIDDAPHAAEFLQHSMGLLTAMIKLSVKRNRNIFDKKKPEDTTQLIATFKVTELVGVVSLLYGMLLHSGTPDHGSSPPPELNQHTLSVTTTAIKMLNFIATLDLNMSQSVLGQEGISLEYRHITSHLISYCSHHSNEELLHEVVLCVGYFTVLNHDNQGMIQIGRPPTVLQQLCALPFQYFSDPRLTNVLFPTLIVCCYHNDQNRSIIEQELSSALLANFIEEKLLEAQQAKLMPSASKKLKNPEKDQADTRMSLQARFPSEEWTKAQEYFSSA
ncbi:S phase cyclin A-associated protein in the endoplasmic reticulum-like isoform X1 [Lingula anatina]|uniref:S phase cyclin A-associated protein in the endoplasmic reticulum-like isoform X1 n=1 Tax=Lingula anatina TaxID=7574 RepID=A0A2R2MPH0_LINAN|nr:S phase cyclin A-associated protein in the endoplasmic reticulum-like isoform X1 [Lingula anatina]|eukprot:XP_023932135.1 S phase cyclin A-associated protein in the endoplasmic reticulum-like isoform X1 [Lingula anatina]